MNYSMSTCGCPLIDQVLKVKINNTLGNALWSRYTLELGDLVSFSVPKFTKRSRRVHYIMRDAYTIVRSDQRYRFQHSYKIGFRRLGKP